MVINKWYDFGHTKNRLNEKTFKLEQFICCDKKSMKLLEMWNNLKFSECDDGKL